MRSTNAKKVVRIGETEASHAMEKTEHFSFGNVDDRASSIWSVQGDHPNDGTDRRYVEEYGDRQMPTMQRTTGPMTVNFKGKIQSDTQGSTLSSKMH